MVVIGIGVVIVIGTAIRFLASVVLAAMLWSLPPATCAASPTPTTTVQEPTQDQQCADPTYLKLHQTICNPEDSPFGIGGTSGGGGGGGLLSGLLHHILGL